MTRRRPRCCGVPSPRSSARPPKAICEFPRQSCAQASELRCRAGLRRFGRDWLGLVELVEARMECRFAPFEDVCMAAAWNIARVNWGLRGAQNVAAHGDLSLSIVDRAKCEGKSATCAPNLVFTRARALYSRTMGGSMVIGESLTMVNAPWFQNSRDTPNAYIIFTSHYNSQSPTTSPFLQMGSYMTNTQATKYKSKDKVRARNGHTHSQWIFLRQRANGTSRAHANRRAKKR